MTVLLRTEQNKTEILLIIVQDLRYIIFTYIFKLHDNKHEKENIYTQNGYTKND